MTRSFGSERLCPRTYGITQNEQRLSHPSCTFRFGRVRSFAASNTGAASNSVWAKISPTITLLNRSPESWSLESRPKESCRRGTNPGLEDEPAEGKEEEEVAISAAWCLCELPTTHVTPGSAASSSGARCA